MPVGPLARGRRRLGVISAFFQVEGFHRGLLIAAAFAAVNLVIGLRSPQLGADAQQLAGAQAA